MHWLAWWPTVIVLAIAVYTDLRSRRIPNWLVFPFLLAGIVTYGVHGGWHGLGQSLLGFAMGASIFGLFAWLGGMGMGDVKLLAAIGAWIGPQQLLIALLMIGIMGGVMAMLWAIKDGFLGELFSNTCAILRGMSKRGLKPHPQLVLSNPQARKMPYAPAIAVGTLLSFFSATPPPHL